MRVSPRFSTFRDTMIFVVPLLLLLAAGFWFAYQFVQPGAPSEVVITTSSNVSPYYRYAERYRDIFARNGVKLTIRESEGSFDNLKALRDPNSGVVAGFLQGGTTNETEAPELMSVGRLFYEPLWVFHRAGETFERLSQFKGKRVLIGPAGSGTEHLALQLLAASGVTPTTATLINMRLPDYVEAFDTGKADVGFLALAADAQTIQRLIKNPSVKLMNMAQADALSRKFPFLTRLVLPQGVIDLDANIPPVDTQLVTTSAALVVRRELHPALVNLLTQAAIDTHGGAALGNAALLQKAGEFPVSVDPEFPVSPDALRVYRAGVPFLQRYLPFRMANFLDRIVVLLVPTLTLLIPIVRFAPMLYRWRMRNRILVWYRELKALERAAPTRKTPEQFASQRAEIDRIEEAVNRVPVPLGFQDQFYNLRLHIDMVRQRIGAGGATALPTPHA